MPKNKMTDLRNHLFETIEMLKDPESGMDVKKASAIADIGRVLVDTARTEINYIKMIGAGGSEFIQPDGRAQLSAVPIRKLESLPTSNIDACLNCTLPECDESSPQCLIQIQKRVA